MKNHRFFYAVLVLYSCLIFNISIVECAQDDIKSNEESITRPGKLSHTSPYVLQIPASEFKLIKRFESSHSYIAIVKHGKTLYIVKQKKYKHSIRKSIVQAILADVLAYSTKQILSQRVWIIPKDTKFPGKRYSDEPASLHTVVPGMSVYNWRISGKHVELDKVERLFSDFSIKLDRYRGMVEEVVENMSKHNDLPPILALHVLTGFYDCHNKNIFYDYHINRFSIIDMDSCYRSNLTDPTYDRISEILFQYKINRKDISSQKLKDALLSFADTVELIIKKNSIAKVNGVITELYELLKDMKKAKDQKRFFRIVQRIEPFLQISYAEGKKIVTLIRTTLLKARKNLEYSVPPRYCVTDLYEFVPKSVFESHA